MASVAENYDTIIEAGRTEGRYWQDLWRYRELFLFLSWRDILVRYKQTVIGIAWSVIRPIMTMLVFTVVFGKLAKLPSDGVPYPVLVFAGLLPWQFFATSLAESSDSLVANASLVSKVYFPRMVIPFSAVMVSLIDFLISFAILMCIVLYYGITFTWRICTLPLFILFAFAASFGAGLWLTSLNVKFRDFRYIVPFVIQFGLYLSPVGFTTAIVPGKWRLLYSLNPMVGVIDGFRWAILGGTEPFYWPGFLISLVLVVMVLVGGIGYFRATERSFADSI